VAQDAHALAFAPLPMSMGMKARRRSGADSKEIPQWKLDMMAAEGSSSAVAAAARAVPRPANDAKRVRDGEKEGAEAPGAAATAGSSGDAEGGTTEQAPPDLPPEDDDDDDDVDLSNYQLCDDDDDEQEEGGGEGAAATTAPAEPLTREELLLMREAADNSSKSRKTFFVDDLARSEEKSLGRERAADRKRARTAVSNTGLSGGF